MSYSFDEIRDAYNSYMKFKSQDPPLHHERYIFPLFFGTYFSYRKIDVLRILSIANTISEDTTYIDVGCGNGDFLKQVRKYLPRAVGVELNMIPCYILNDTRPDYIHPLPVEILSEKESSFDMAFVGWMQYGVDFRKYVAKLTECIVTTFDAGGQCGINCGCEYEEFGFQKIASWRTPSWIDLNGELMNKFYTSFKDKNFENYLSKLRTANNLWYVYSTKDLSNQIAIDLKSHFQKEKESRLFLKERFDFENLLDECGFNYNEKLPFQFFDEKNLWEIEFYL